MTPRRQPRRFRPESLRTTHLETRALLSGTGHAPSAIVSTLSTSTISGKQNGTYVYRPLNDADGSSITTLKFSGKSAALGKFTAKATIESKLYVHDNGSITFSNKSGSITMSLVGTGQGHYSVTATGSTGKFAGATESGLLTIHYKKGHKIPGGGAGVVSVQKSISVTLPG